MSAIAICIATIFVAYANGANDNFKGVATLFGSQTTNYKTAIWWATLTTFAGSITSIVLAEKLLQNFSGKGLVTEAIANTNQFHFAALGKSFFIPLLVSPLMAIILGGLFYCLLRYIRMFLHIDKAWCVCAGNQQELIPIATTEKGNINLLQKVIKPDITIDTEEKCNQKYIGNFLGINSQKLVDFCHFISAGVVSFARGLNDTPKIVALLLGVTTFSIRGGMFAVGLGMAIGGLLNAQKVAHTVSKKITTLNPGKGLAANLVTGFLVIFASRFGVPVSTTHVFVGSIFGVGILSQTTNINVFTQVLMS